MSVSLMAAAFRAEVPATAKLVLLALCDCANDQGECYPGVMLLTKKCSLTDRAIQKAISDLERCGFLSRDMRAGRSTTYRLTPDGGVWGSTPEPRSPPTPERRSPPNVVHPRTTFTTVPNHVHPTPERRSPITITETSMKQKTAPEPAARVAAVGVVELVADGLSEESAAELLALRRKKRANLTPLAWKGIKAEADKAGWSLDDVVKKMAARGWQSFEADWVKTESGGDESALRSLFARGD